MTFSIPAVDQLGWGEPLQKHLAQLNDPDTGGLIHVANVAERDSRFWPNGATDKDEYANKTIYVSNTGTFHVWTVSSNPAINRKWRELNWTLRTVINPETSGFNTWENIASRPWQDGDTTHNADLNFTGYNKELGFFEAWSPSPINKWIPLANFSKAERKTGSGTISSDPGDIFKLNLSGATYINQGIDVGTTIYIDGRSAYVRKRNTDTQIEFYPNALAASVYSVSDIAGFTVAMTLESAILNVTAGDPIAAGLSVGDLIYSRNGAITPGTIIAISPSSITLNAVQRASGYASSFAKLNKIVNKSFQYELAALSLKNSENKDLGYFTSDGNSILNNVSAERILNGYSKLESTNQNTIYATSTYLSSPVASGINLNAMFALNITTARAQFENDNGGSNWASAIWSESGHSGILGNPTTANFCVLRGRMICFKGTINNGYGVFIDSSFSSNGKISNYFPYYENAIANSNIDGTVCNIRNFFLNKTGIGRDNNAGTNMLEVQGNILATGTITPGSDRRWKENIVKIDSALEKISLLEGVTYNWKDREEKGEERQIGLIAQDVEKAFPEAVKKDNEGYMSLNYDGLVGALVEGIKELKDIIQTLNERIAVLENK